MRLFWLALAVCSLVMYALTDELSWAISVWACIILGVLARIESKMDRQR